MNSILDWLNGARGYTEGLALYEVYGQDARLLAALRQGHSTYRQGRMETALRDLLQHAARPVPAPIVPEVKKVHVNEVVMPEAAVEENKDSYREKWLPLYAEMQALRHTLLSAKDDEERGEMAHKILSLERQCMMWWARRDYQLRTGSEMPEESAPSDAVTDKNALHRSLTNLRTYITKTTKQYETAESDTKRETAAAKLAKYQEQMLELIKGLEHG